MRRGAAGWLTCIGLILTGSLTLADTRPSSDLVVSVAIDHKWATTMGPGFVAGVRRAFQQDSVLLERTGLKRGRDDRGKVVNRIRLVSRSGLFQIADRGWFRRVTPDPSRAAKAGEDSLVLIRPGSLGSIIVDYVYPRGSRPDTTKKPDIFFLTTRVSVSPSRGLADSLEWTNLRVHWAERT